MKTAEELRESWDKNSDLREGWRRILESPEWNAVSSLVLAESLAKARSVNRLDADTVLSRALVSLNGVCEALEALKSAANDPAPPESPMVEYDDEYVAKLQRQKLANQ